MGELVLYDLRIVARSLRKERGLTAIVSAVEAVLTRPLPYDDPDRLVQ